MGPASHTIQLSNPRILVVDDDCAIRMLLRESFEDAGFVVEQAQSGTEAIMLVRTFQPDIVLLDVVMPGLDGFATCGRIHEIVGFEDLPVLMMSAMEDVEFSNRAYDSGAVDVVSKPLNWMTLIHRVRRQIDSARMAQQLEKAIARQCTLIDILEVLYFRLDADGTIREFRAGNAMGKAIETKRWEGKQIQDVMLPDNPGEFLHRLAQCWRSNEQQSFVQRFAFDGEARDYQVKATATDADEVTIVVQVMQGTTTEPQPRGAAFFRNVVEKLPDPILILDIQGRIEYQNPAARKRLENGSRPTSRGSGLNFVHPEDATVLFNGVVNAFESNGQGSHCQFRVRNRTGAWRVWDSRLVNLLRETSAGGILLIGHDITELKESEFELAGQRSHAEAMNQAKSEYLAVVSHELRNPLNTILGHADLMLQDMPRNLTEKQIVSLQRIRKSAREVLDLVFSILDITRLDMGALPLEYQEVSVPELLEEIREETELVHPTSGLDMTWRIDRGLKTLYTDGPKFKIVVRNLIGNALKFTRAGNITVDAQSTDLGVEVRVTDTGAGIAEDRQPLIFERFYGEKGSHESTGLGLYIVKRFMDSLGGDIHVKSVPGEGTSFCVSFHDRPRAQSAEPSN